MTEGPAPEPIGSPVAGLEADSPAKGPVPEEERLPALDVLRGLAMLLILPANLPSFAWPLALHDRTHVASPAQSEAWAHALVRVVVDLKMLSLLALLLGAGIALQRARADDRAGYLRRGLSRHAVLAVIGLVHALGLWYGDILFPYAVIGCVAVAVIGAWGVRPLPLAAGGLVTIGLAVGMTALLGLGAVASGFQDTGPATVEAALAAPSAGAEGLAPGAGEHIRLVREGRWGEAFLPRLDAWFQMLGACLLVYGWRVLGLMLLGAAGHAAGLLRPDPAQRPRALLVRLACVGLGGGVPLEVLRAAALARLEPTQLGWWLVEACHQVSALLVPVGLAAAVLLLPKGAFASAPLRALANVGRLALTCYLSQTLLCTLLFDGRGLGLYASVTRVQLLGLAAALTALQLVGATAWLRSFRMGPAEWLWRTASLGSAPPLRR